MATIPMTPFSPSASFGALLRGWRQRRRRSQLDLALDTEVSQRHLSFVESGRAAPSREVVVRLAEQLDVPLRERNVLLLPPATPRSMSNGDLKTRPCTPRSKRWILSCAHMRRTRHWP